MAVVAAGMHFPGVRGLEVRIHGFADGERIHVGAEGHGLGLSAVEIGADRMAFGREDLAGEVCENAADVGSRFGKVEVEFGDAVKIAAVAGKTLEHD